MPSRTDHPTSHTKAGAIALLVASALFLLGTTGCEDKTPPTTTSRAVQTGGGEVKPIINPTIDDPRNAILAKAKYAGSKSCTECHQAEHDQWVGSDHDKAMALATPETVLGDFNDVEFKHYDLVTKFTRKGDKFFVETEGPTGARDTFEVKYTFGVRPLQQYLVEFPDGRVQCLTTAWDVEKKAWYSLYPNERTPHWDWLHWTKGGQNWNYMCSECHSTDVKKDYRLNSDTYHTTFREINVTCESCHGPGSEHIKWATQEDASEKAFDLTMGLTVQMKDIPNARAQVDVCAQCHSRRRIVHGDYFAGKPFLDHYVPELLHEPLYQPDGQMIDEVYVYGSFVQSKMYHMNVKCSDCHNPHTTKIIAQGNNLCIRCHKTEVFNVPQHHHHAVDSPGSQCVNCHMRVHNYMVVDARRDHSFQIPRPDLTVKIGVPNACDDCHADKGAQWSADQIVAWNGPTRPNEPHFAPTFAAARKDDPTAKPELLTIINDVKRPAIIRATALTLLERFPPDDATVKTVQAALVDAQPLVRGTAVSNADQLIDPAMVDRLIPLLNDPVRFVRTEAARVLARVATIRFADKNAPESKLFASALEEYRAGQNVLLDQPGTHLNLAVLNERLGDVEKAEAQYQTAIKQDPTFYPARLNLAMLYNLTRRPDEAEVQLREAVRLQPKLADPAYSLGLLLAERADAAQQELQRAAQQRQAQGPSEDIDAFIAEQTASRDKALQEAARWLGTAAQLAKTNARMHYNYGLALMRLDKLPQAEEALITARSLDTKNPDFEHALAMLFAQQERWDDAVRHAEALGKLVPNDPSVPQFIEQLKQMREAARK